MAGGWGRNAPGYWTGAMRTSENAVSAKFAEFTFRNCLKSSPVAVHESLVVGIPQGNRARLPVFRRLLRLSFSGYRDFLDSVFTHPGV
jgi:hypothetical protein